MKLLTKGFAFLLIVLIVSLSSTVSQEEHVYSEAELIEMTDAELEDICIQRGFELVKNEIDPSTGEAYTLTHDDYVEAAQRCLAIEQEM
jgi:hypothetical protein